MRDIRDAMARRWADTPRRPVFADVEAAALDRCPELAGLRPVIGDTPLVPVRSRGGRGRVWLKAEGLNATGSVKARTAYGLLCGMVAEHGPGRALVEYSGGSLGLALSEFCGRLDLDFHLAVPHGAPAWLSRAATAWGARVSHGEPGTGFLGAMDHAVRVAAAEDRHLLLQHAAAIGAAVHEEQTGAEIVAQLRAAGVVPAGFAASVGSAGTVVGVGRALTAEWPACRPVAVFPAEAPHGDPRPPSSERRMNGTGGLGYGLRHPLLDDEPWIELRGVAYPDALDGMAELRERDRIAVCSSGAAAWRCASELVDGPGGGDAVAVVASRGTVDEWNHVAERRLAGVPGVPGEGR